MTAPHIAPRPYASPPTITWPSNLPPALCDLKATYERLSDERRVITRARLAAEQQLQRADHLDRQAIADARIRDEQVPAESHRDRAAAELHRLRGLEDGLIEALLQVARQVETAVAQARPEWRERLLIDEARAAETYAASVEALDAARQKVLAVRGNLAWLERYPHKPNMPPADPALTLHGAQVNFTEIVNSLRTDATPTRPLPPAEIPDSPSDLTVTADGVLFLPSAE